MPRVKRFEELPGWLQETLRLDWRNVHGPKVPNHPPIGDPEYRVYRIGDTGWWAVDSGTGGVWVERERVSHAYVDLPKDSPVKAAVDEEGRRCRTAAGVESLCEVILGHGVDVRALVEAAELEGDMSDAEKLKRLAEILHVGLSEGRWPRRSCSGGYRADCMEGCTGSPCLRDEGGSPAGIILPVLTAGK